MMDGTQKEEYFDITISECTWIKSHSLMIVITDVSEKKKASELKKMNDFKDVVLASVSHDLKTPLNSMLTQVDLSLKCKEIGKMKQHILIVQKSGKMLIHQVYDILDYSYYMKTH